MCGLCWRRLVSTMSWATMKIGCTYDLRDEYLRQGFSEEETAECDPLGTIQAVVAALESLGHQVERIGGVRNLMACLARGDRWDLVFNFAEGLYGFGREAQVPALLDAYDIHPIPLHPTRRKDFARQGYKLDQFVDAFTRYLPADPIIQSLAVKLRRR